MNLHHLTPFFAAAALAACASSPAPRGPEKADDFADLPWGAQPALIEQRYPDAGTDDGGFHTNGEFVGRPAGLRFNMADTGLSGIRVQFQSEYASMDACAIDFAAVRSDMNAIYGRSQADNLAAYWDQETREIQLSCDPNDVGASLTVTFRPPDPE